MSKKKTKTAAKKVTPNKYPDGPCFFCKKVIDHQHFCYGCKQYVCDDCCASAEGWSVADATGHGHSVHDHQEPAIDEEEYE